MQVGLYPFDAETVNWFRGAVTEPGRTRHSLARELCVREHWTGERGEYYLGSVRPILPALTDRLGIGLPPTRSAGAGMRPRRRAIPMSRWLAPWPT